MFATLVQGHADWIKETKGNEFTGDEMNEEINQVRDKLTKVVIKYGEYFFKQDVDIVERINYELVHLEQRIEKREKNTTATTNPPTD